MQFALWAADEGVKYSIQLRTQSLNLIFHLYVPVDIYYYHAQIANPTKCPSPWVFNLRALVSNFQFPVWVTSFLLPKGTYGVRASNCGRLDFPGYSNWCAGFSSDARLRLVLKCLHERLLHFAGCLRDRTSRMGGVMEQIGNVWGRGGGWMVGKDLLFSLRSWSLPFWVLGEEVHHVDVLGKQSNGWQRWLIDFGLGRIFQASLTMIRRLLIISWVSHEVWEIQISDNYQGSTSSCISLSSSRMPESSGLYGSWCCCH